MAQQHETKINPYRSVEALSFRICCISSSGKRKKSYQNKPDADAAAFVLRNGRRYRCLFNPDTHHVTTKIKKVSALHCEYTIIILQNRIMKIEVGMEALKESIAAMTPDTPLAEIQSATAAWDEFSRKKRKAIKNLAYQKDLLMRIQKNGITPYRF